MAALGRKPMGPKLVTRLEGSARAKRRLEVILETIAGRLTIDQACDDLGISEARFHQLRAEVLQVGLAQLEPRPLGRPFRACSPEAATIVNLERQLEELKLELAAAEIRLQIAQSMPQLLNSAEASQKKTARQPAGRKRPNRSRSRHRQRKPAQP